MLIRLILLLIVVPLLELALLLTLKDVMGFEATLVVVICTGLGGAWLLRRQGTKTLRAIRSELNGGRLPSNELLDGVLLLIAGVLLLTPGILTDVLGIALLIPPMRFLFRGLLVEYFRRRWKLSRFSAPTAKNRSEVIDSYVVQSQEKQE